MILNIADSIRWVDAVDFDGIPERQPGSYLLIVWLERQVTIQAGRLPERLYHRGWYAYSGSAMNGLKPRLNRYLNPARKRHWHIDYLLERGNVAGAWLVSGTERHECQIAAGLREKLEGIPGFGSSDCRCPGHLFYAPDGKNIREMVTFFNPGRFIQ